MKEIKKYIDLLIDGTKTMFKEFFKSDTNKKQRANMLTFSRLVAPVINLVLTIVGVASGTYSLFIASAIIATLAASTDFFDGRSARKHGSQSEYGELLDQVSDKIFCSLNGICLSIINPFYLVLLLGEAIISGINIKYELKHKDVKFSSSKLGKIKMWPLFLTLGLGFFSKINSTMFNISNIAVLTTFVMQLLTAGDYIVINDKKIKEVQQQLEKISIEDAEEKDKEKTKELEIDLRNQSELNEENSRINNIQNRISEYQNLKELALSIDSKDIDLEEENQKQYRKEGN